VVEAPEYPGATTRHGHQGVREALESWRMAWEELRFEPEEIVEVGDDQVLTVGRQYVRAQETRVEFDTAFASLYRLREGKVVRAQFFLDPEEARSAAGLT
jgi:ketosteroid isomerase-like protein